MFAPEWMVFSPGAENAARRATVAESAGGCDPIGSLFVPLARPYPGTNRLVTPAASRCREEYLMMISPTLVGGSLGLMTNPDSPRDRLKIRVDFS